MSQQLILKTADLSTAPEGVSVFFAGTDLSLGETAAANWQKTGLSLEKLAAAIRFTGKPGQVLEVLAPEGLTAERLWLAGQPAPDDDGAVSGLTRREQGGALMARILTSRAEKLVIVFDGAEHTPEAVAEFAAGLKLKHYRFDRYKTRAKTEDEGSEPDTLTVTLAVADPAATEKAMVETLAMAEGVLYARELVNTPPNALGPLELAAAANALADLGVEVEILTDDEMKKLGMGALLAVAQGSVRPGRLAIMKWNGGKPDAAPLALVGKGVVFDTGGISIKPAASMEDMKGDMGGAAAVIGTMKALALRKAKANVVGVCGLVENMPDGNAYRPGDIVTSMSGQTIEIVNTDAEGRLVLADALWYTQDRFKPVAMINLATLTGAHHCFARPGSCRSVLQRRRAGRKAVCRRHELGRQALAPADGALLRQADRIPLRRHEEFRAGAMAVRSPLRSSSSASSTIRPGPISTSPAPALAVRRTIPIRPGAPASVLPFSTGWSATITKRRLACTPASVTACSVVTEARRRVRQ